MCNKFIEYRPTYYNDFVYNPSYFKCVECGKWCSEYEIRDTTPVEIIFTDNPPISEKELRRLNNENY